MRLLSDHADSFDNNFDFLRFLAAMTVLLWHCFILFGVKKPQIVQLMFVDGVLVFFIISGFLITKSWFSKPEPSIFIKKRFLRIFPAYTCVILLSVFILGPLLTTLPLKQYFSSEVTWTYLKNIFMINISYRLPGVFASNPFPYAINGSLWSLPLEVFMYLTIMCIGVMSLFKKKFLFPTIFILCYFLITFYFVGPNFKDLFLFMPAYHLARLGFAFLIASALFIYRDKIPLSLPIFLTALAFYFMGLLSSYTIFMNLLTLPYIVLYIAYAKIPYINKFGKYGDFSYGIYIYAFPIQQTIALFYLNNLNFLTYTTLSIILTLIAAITSYHLIEKPALNLKKVPFRKTIKEQWGRYLDKFNNRS